MFQLFLTIHVFSQRDLLCFTHGPYTRGEPTEEGLCSPLYSDKADTFLVQEIFQLVRPPVFYPQSKYYLFLNQKVLCSPIIFIKKSLMTNFLIEKRQVTSNMTQN